MSVSRIASIIVVLLLVLFGSVFALQGDGVIGGSFMSNNPTYIYVGGVLVLIGLILLVFARRTGSMMPSKPMPSTSTSSEA